MESKYMGTMVFCNKISCTNNVGSRKGNVCLALTECYEHDCPFYKPKGEEPKQTIERLRKAMNK